MQFGLIEAVRHWATYRPTKTALHSNGRQFTYAELLARAEGVASELLATGSGPRVAIAAQRKAEFLTAVFGVMRAGKSAVLLNHGLPDGKLRVMVEDTAPDLALCERDLTSSGALGVPSTIPRVIVEDCSRAIGRSFVWPDRKAEDEWGIVFSSGTTGVPKGVKRDHESMVTEIIGWSLELPLTRHSVFYVGRPLYYTGGLVLALSCLFVGGTLIANDYHKDDDPVEVWADYERELNKRAIEWSFFVPDQLRAFVNARQKPRSPGKYILVMGAKIGGDSKRAARAVLGSEVVESWGNSESLGTITEPEDLDERPESIGRPFLTDELFVLDEDYKRCGPGEVGRLAGGDTAGFSEYVNRPDATLAVKRDALILSDDLAYVDEAGYFYVRGRVQDVVVRGKATVFLPEIAEKLRRRAEVKEVDICAFDGASGVRLVAAVVLNNPLVTSEAAYCTTLNGDLEPGEQLARAVVLRKLPYLPSGKVDRVQLQRLLCNGGGGQKYGVEGIR